MTHTRSPFAHKNSYTQTVGRFGKTLSSLGSVNRAAPTSVFDNLLY